MKERIRGATHLALIATLALTLGISAVALATVASTPQDDGHWIGRVCLDTPGTIYDPTIPGFRPRRTEECIEAKCWTFWHDQTTSEAYYTCIIEATIHPASPII